MPVYLTRWQPSDDPAEPVGVATFSVNGHALDLRLSHLHAVAVANLMQAAAQQARSAQAEYLRGALNRALDDAK